MPGGAAVVAGDVAILLVDAPHARHGHAGTLHGAHGGWVHLRVEAPEGRHLLKPVAGQSPSATVKTFSEAERHSNGLSFFFQHMPVVPSV